MKIRTLTALWLCVLVSVQAIRAQPTGKIFGQIVNATTSEPLADVNVFLSHTMRGAHTDASGNFEITGIEPGNYEVVATRVGFSSEVGEVSITAAGSVKKIDFRMKPIVYQLKGVDVTARRDRRWRNGFSKFKELFLGDTPNAKETQILNPEVLDFDVEDISGAFRAQAAEPIVLENRALGYQLTFVLQSFVLDPHRELLTYSGRPFFAPLQPKTDEEHARWEEIRRQTYEGSLSHLLAAIARDKTEEEGFILWKDFMRQNQIQGRIVFDRAQMSQNMIDMKPLRVSEILNETNRQGEYELSFREYVRVVYRGKVGRHDGRFRKDRTPDEQISWVVMEEPWAILYRDGYIYPSSALRVHGYMASMRAAELMPREYVLQQINLTTKPLEQKPGKKDEKPAEPVRPEY